MYNISGIRVCEIGMGGEGSVGQSLGGWGVERV